MMKETIDMTMGVRRVQTSDLHTIVRIHDEAFESFFLTQLGDRFLHLYYSAVLQFEGGIMLLAENRTKDPLGFVAGFAKPSEFYRHLRKQRLSIARAVAFSLIRSPRLVRRLISSASIAVDRTKLKSDAGQVELSSLAVTAAGRGLGTGHNLLAAFRREVFLHGCNSITLNTDAVDNDAVNDFYLAEKFVPIRQFETKSGRRMNEYQLNLEVEQGPDA